MLTNYPEKLPIPCRRILDVADRNPCRVAPLVRRVLQRATEKSDTEPLDYAWALFTLGCVLLYGERFTEGCESIRQADAVFATHHLDIPRLYCSHALLVYAQPDDGWLTLQHSWQMLIDGYIAAGLHADELHARIHYLRHIHAYKSSKEALTLSHDMVSLVEESGSLKDRAVFHQISSDIHTELAHFIQAEIEIERATDLFTQQRNQRHVGKCYLKRAWILQRQERFDEARDSLERAVNLFQRLDLPFSLALCWRNQSMVMNKTGRYNIALALLLRARNTLRDIGQHSFIGSCDLTMGTIAYFTGLFDLALAAYRRAQEAYKTQGLTNPTLLSQRNQAMVLRAQGKPEVALHILNTIERAVRLAGDELELSEIIQAQSQALLDLELYHEALDKLDIAYDLFTRLGNQAAAAESVLVKGEVFLQLHQYQDAAHCFETSQRYLTDRPMYLWRIEYGLGRCAHSQDDLTTALEHYQTASTTIASLRQTLNSEHASSGVFALAQDLYHHALHLAASQGNATLLVMLAEQQHGIALRHHIAATEWYIPPEMKATYHQHNERLRGLTSETTSSDILNAALVEYIDMLLQVRHSTPGRDVPIEPLDLANVRAHLTSFYADQWCVLVYIPCGDKLFIVTFAPHLAEPVIEQRVWDATAHYLFSRASSPRFRKHTYLDLRQHMNQKRPAWATLTELGDYLLPATIRHLLHPDLRLLIVPSGSLHAIPWAALRVHDAWLCEYAIIHLLPSLATWATLVEQQFRISDSVSSPRTALLTGCSHFGTRAEDLPYVSNELNLVAERWSGSVIRLENEQATREAFVQTASQNQPALIHVSSHAQLVAVGGLLAHIKLWDEDVLLSEISQLHLRGTLVVLAACDGAASEVLPGDEVLSLSQAFLAAGARDVVANIWSLYGLVLDDFWKALYDRLAQGYDTPAALTYAQRSLIARGSQHETAYSPLIWGGINVRGCGIR